MFGLFKRQMAPEGPVEFKAEMPIERPADHIYALLDFADERNAKRAEGNRVLPGGGAGSGGSGRWRLLMTGMDSHEFLLDLIEAERPLRYEYECRAVPTLGRLVSAIEAWTIEPLGEHGCNVRLVVTAEFVTGLTERQFAKEVSMMSAGCHNALARLKIHAEHGANAARDAVLMTAEQTRVGS